MAEERAPELTPDEKAEVARFGIHTAPQGIPDVDCDKWKARAAALEAATGGQHIESKHWAEVGRLRNEVARLSQQSQSEPEYVTALRARVAELEALIERARKAPYHEVIAGGIRQDSVYTILGSIKTEGSF